MKNSIAFYLMTFKGLWILKEVINKFDPSIIEVVIVSRDNNIQNDYYNEINLLCQNHQIPVYDKNYKYQIKSEYIFAISWRWLINTNNKLIVLHDSLLPKYRGFAPLVNNLIHKEPTIGVTAIFAAENYDCGDIILQKQIKIDYPIKIQNAIDLITPLYLQLVVSITKKILSGKKITGRKQNDSNATYSLWRDESDYFIDWNQTSEDIKRFIDSVGYPYAGASSHLDNQIVRIIDATLINDLKIVNRDVGKIIFFDNKRPVIVCKKGLLRIDNITDNETKKDILPLIKIRTRFK